MFKFLVKHSGKICTVLGIIGVVIGLGALIAAPYVVVPICVGVTTAIFSGAALIAGACYIGREYGKYSERELNNSKKDDDTSLQLENIKDKYKVTENLSEEAILKFKTQDSRINTVEARISKLEAEQKVRSLHHSLEELHREREEYGIKSSSDSDSESEEEHLLSEQSIFTQNQPKNRRQTSEAANDSNEDIGVTPRHKKQN